MKNPTIGREEFLAILKPKVTASKLAQIEDAYTLAKYGHRNQLRDAGERYFEHPKSVAMILTNEFGIYKPDMIIMALLHDIVEDTFILSTKGLEKLFGQQVVSGLSYLTKTDTVEKYVAKLGDCPNIDVLVVKFADRLHNLRTMEGVSKEKSLRKRKETNDLYMPLLTTAMARSSSKQKAQLNYLKSAILDILAI
jgi:(p)ppGpp synthase/HD superfamily hydrolase